MLLGSVWERACAIRGFFSGSFCQCSLVHCLDMQWLERTDDLSEMVLKLEEHRNRASMVELLVDIVSEGSVQG